MRLLGLLIGVGLLLGLTMFVIDKVNEPDDPAGRTAAEAGLDPSARPAGEADAAKIAACNAAREQINVAETAYHAQFFRYADLATLVLGGNLAEAPTEYVVESADGYVTYHLVGQGGCT